MYAPSSIRVKFLRKALLPQNEEQIKNFRKSCEILIAEPLRLCKLAEDVKFKHLERIVVDEGDKMFEMGYLEQLKGIFDKKSVAKYFFSATF